MIVKVCGMREAENIRQVEQLGINLMGFICAPKSPRYVAQAPAYLPVAVKRVGVFVDATLDFIAAKAKELGLDYLQLHGAESPAFCQEAAALTGLPVLKALPIYNKEDFALAAPYEGKVDMLVFDTKCASHGGSGEKFDWTILSAYSGPTPFLLAGGIGPDDAPAIRALSHPRLAGIDLNSRFETAHALKDTNKLKQFINDL